MERSLFRIPATDILASWCRTRLVRRSPFKQLARLSTCHFIAMHWVSPDEFARLRTTRASSYEVLTRGVARAVRRRVRGTLGAGVRRNAILVCSYVECRDEGYLHAIEQLDVAGDLDATGRRKVQSRSADSNCGDCRRCGSLSCVANQWTPSVASGGPHRRPLCIRPL